MKPVYKRMLAKMSEKDKRSRKRIRENWYLYLLRCADGSLYTGITKNLEERFKKHNAGKASRYTRTRRPVELLYQERCGSRTKALVRECTVKAFPKAKKEKLAASNSQ